MYKLSLQYNVHVISYKLINFDNHPLLNNVIKRFFSYTTSTIREQVFVIT